MAFLLWLEAPYVHPTMTRSLSAEPVFLSEGHTLLLLDWVGSDLAGSTQYSTYSGSGRAGRPLVVTYGT